MSFIINPYSVQAAAAAEFNDDYSIDLDGVNDYITFGDVSELNSVSAFTFSFWVKLNNTSGGNYIISK